MNCDYIASCAMDLSSTYSRDPFDAADGTGAIVRFKDLGSLKGLFLSSTPTPAIVINSNLNENTQKIVCAHELGHFLLHKETSFSCESIIFEAKASIGILEREANLFAAFFLVDFEEAERYLKSGYSVAQTAAILNIDTALLQYRLNAAGMCDAPDSTFLK